MIAFPSGVRVWLATGHTDMRKGFGSLAVLVQETLKRDPHAGDLYLLIPTEAATCNEMMPPPITR
jgi:transposase